MSTHYHLVLPQPTAMSSSFLSRSPKTIIRLFLNPVNSKVKTHGIELSGHDWLHMKAEIFARKR